MRLSFNATTMIDVHQYYETRARQWMHCGFVWKTTELIPYIDNDVVVGYHTFFEKNDVMYQSFYLLEQYRNMGKFKEACRKYPFPFVTMTECGIEHLLNRYEIDYVKPCSSILESKEYLMVQEFYGDKRAERSQAFLMNHIDEGIAVMTQYGASNYAKRAFCLHPLLQNDVDFAANYDRIASKLAFTTEGTYIFGLAIEYRSVANEYLAKCKMPDDGIRLSPLLDVNDMLIGDKVQNYKDFVRYHQGTHPNSDRLTEYFEEWISALGLVDSDEKIDFYNSVVEKISYI